TLLSALGAKQLGLLRDLLPKAGVIALLVSSNDPTAEAQVASAQEAARAVGQELMVLRAGTEGEIDSAFTTLVQRRTAALVVGTGAFFVTRMDRIVTLAAHHAVPTMYFRREFADAGGLMSYGS